MIPANFRVRRATLDDVGVLMELWKTMRFPADELARRITEFQVAESENGQVLGAVGLQMAQKQGLIHSEAFLDFAHADLLRPALWERLHAVAVNHGLLRFWTQETAPFWHHSGLIKADEEALQRLPPTWGNTGGHWLTLKLKDDVAEILSADRAFAAFMESEKERSQRTLRHARILRLVVLFFAFAAFLVIIVGTFFMLRKNPQLLHPR